MTGAPRSSDASSPATEIVASTNRTAATAIAADWLTDATRIPPSSGPMIVPTASPRLETTLAATSSSGNLARDGSRADWTGRTMTPADATTAAPMNTTARRRAQPDSDSAPDRPERSQDVGRHQHAPAAEPGSRHAGERAGQRRGQHPDEPEDAHAQRAAGLIRDDQESDEQDPVAGDPARVGRLDAPDRGVGDRRLERAGDSANGRPHGSRVECGRRRGGQNR